MKSWFLSLDENKRKKVIIMSWTIAGLTLLLSAATIFFSYVFIACLIVSILFTKWRSLGSSKSSTDHTPIATATKHTYTPSVETAEEQERKRKREEFLQRKREEARAELKSLPRYAIELSTERRNRKTGYVEPTFSNITSRGKYNEFVVFDTETTGVAPSRERIIELAAIRFVDGVPTEVFETFINPEKPIPPEASAVNHITDEMVADSPTISQVLPAFEAFVGDSPLVAHNLSFDLKFIYYSGGNIFNTPRKYFDTLKIAQKMLKKPKPKYDKEFETWETDYDSEYDVDNHKLETLAEYYNITFPDQHRATADAIVTGKLFLHLISDKQSSV